jgi:hypothetical protein
MLDFVAREMLLSSLFWKAREKHWTLIDAD